MSDDQTSTPEPDDPDGDVTGPSAVPSGPDWDRWQAELAPQPFHLAGARTVSGEVILKARGSVWTISADGAAVAHLQRHKGGWQVDEVDGLPWSVSLRRLEVQDDVGTPLLRASASGMSGTWRQRSMEYDIETADGRDTGFRLQGERKGAAVIWTLGLHGPSPVDMTAHARRFLGVMFVTSVRVNVPEPVPLPILTLYLLWIADGG